MTVVVVSNGEQLSVSGCQRGGCHGGNRSGGVVVLVLAVDRWGWLSVIAIMSAPGHSSFEERGAQHWRGGAHGGRWVFVGGRGTREWAR